MSGRGRPKKTKNDRRERQLHVLLTEAEHLIIERAAKAKTLGASTWARSVLLNAAKSESDKASE